MRRGLRSHVVWCFVLLSAATQAQVSLPAILSGGAAEAYQQGDKGDLRGEIRNLLEKQQGTPAAAGSASNEDESSVIRR
jgi:hypothetical protein